MELKRGRERDIELVNKELWKEFHDRNGLEKTWKKRFYKIVETNGSEEIWGVVIIKILSGVLYLEELIIKSEYRGKKIGHFAMDFVENLAKKEKCHKIRITTCPELMPNAVHLYKKYGFKQEAVLKKDYFKKDWIILSKLIEENL
ncbi:GNAT family N-acetyltransferase [Candidatus Woesearchaeota archaeon]|nr:GNAT family N-acetyltransferase [Candidatus Woesearchaeota archaeon]